MTQLLTGRTVAMMFWAVAGWWAWKAWGTGDLFLDRWVVMEPGEYATTLIIFGCVGVAVDNVVDWRARRRARRIWEAMLDRTGGTV